MASLSYQNKKTTSGYWCQKLTLEQLFLYLFKSHASSTKCTIVFLNKDGNTHCIRIKTTTGGLFGKVYKATDEFLSILIATISVFKICKINLSKIVLDRPKNQTWVFFRTDEQRNKRGVATLLKMNQIKSIH